MKLPALNVPARWSFLLVAAGGLIAWAFMLSPASLSSGSDHIALTLIRATSSDPIQAVVFPDQVGPGLPIRLTIPRIKVDAVIESVGLTNKGIMDVPKELTSPGWLNIGPRPGEVGSAVIDGHFGWKYGVAAVFNKLHTLRPGDKVFVADERGAITSFIVRERRSYEPTADASVVFGSTDGKAHLNLITCEGEWDEAKQAYSDRLVVFTDEELLE